MRLYIRIALVFADALARTGTFACVCVFVGVALGGCALACQSVWFTIWECARACLCASGFLSVLHIFGHQPCQRMHLFHGNIATCLDLLLWQSSL